MSVKAGFESIGKTIRLLGIFTILFAGFLESSHAESVDKKIMASKRQLVATRKDYAKMDRKLARIARQMSAEKRHLRELDKTIAKMDKQIMLNEVLLAENIKRLAELKKSMAAIERTKQRQEKELAALLTGRYILEEIKKHKGIESVEDVIETNAISSFMVLQKKELAKLERSYIDTITKYNSLKREIEGVKKTIAKMQKIKKDAIDEKKLRKEIIAKLKSRKQEYTRRLKRLQKEERSLRTTLARLSILKRKEEEAVRRKEALRRKRLYRKEREKVEESDKIRVRTLGSSYQKHLVGHYRGPKTSSPVGKAKLIKRFGQYVDPVYRIRIFNESVTLKPYRKNAKVRAVLPGRVVFAKNTPMLGNVVIIKHNRNLHTIYAKMDKIAPTVREGLYVKKGQIIGRVEKELMFEVTQKNRHIDPMELIRLY